ncbi:MAG: hypothetical protein N3J91_16025 [Verrucomicrobiae bacterium]|nr:hypothetical protein [Verrucomicrobiae bacterium]
MLLAHAVLAAAPEICRVQGGNTKLIWGTGFTPGEVEVRSWRVPLDTNRVWAALGQSPYPGRDLLPATPPPEARKLNVLDTDPRGLVMAVEFETQYNAEGFYDARAGGHVCWVRNREGWSRPWLVTSAQPWWVSPETAVPGGEVRVFGRTLDARWVALKRRSDGQVVRLTNFRRGQHPLYEVRVSLPSELAPGDYDLFVHNGAGGEAGWGGPVKLAVALPVKPATNFFNVREMGAHGDGFHDDTAALRRALVQAGAAGGGTVFLPPGAYAISATLWVPTNVTLQGAGPQSSLLVVLEGRPMRWDVPVEIARAMPGHFRARQEGGNRGAMLWLRDHARVTDLGFVDGPGTLQVIFGSHSHCRIERCHLRATHSTEPAVMVEWGSYGFVLKDSVIESAQGGVFLVHGPHEQALVSGNTIRNIQHGQANNLFIRAFVHSIIEHNTLEDGDRNWVSQTGFTSGYHSILLGNRWRNNIPRRHNSGENMYEAGEATWHGPVARADRASLTVAGAPFEGKKLGGEYVLVLDGPGLGQYRRVVSNSVNTLYLEPPWEVLPEATTYIMTGKAYAETLWIDNEEENTANWTGFWGNNFGHVVDGHAQRRGGGFYLWAWQNTTPSPVAFCELIGVRLMERGNISLLGPLVFGNSVRFCEITGFRYGPSFHIQPGWLQGMDPAQRAAVDLPPARAKITGLPATAPLKDWNLIEGTHIYDGPRGIRIAPPARHTQLRRNAIHVDGVAVMDEAQQMARADARKSWQVKEGQEIVYFNVQPERGEAEVAAARAEIPPVQYTPPPDRWDALPLSRARLAETGGVWRVVMLGDSIVNDTWRSRFGESLQARMPHTRLELTAVVAGGKGCWWYAQQGRVSRHVAPLQPDLLIIGGISHNQDLEAVRAVIREIRVTRPVDVLLCTGPFGAADPTDDAKWAAERADTPKAWHVRLAALAREEKAGFLDLQLLWGEYVRASGKPLDWYKRDPVHANARGEAVLGRFMTEYLTP